jgi:hypothetical protein
MMADRRGVPILGDASAVTLVMAGRALGRRVGTKRKRKKATKKAAARRAPAKRRKTTKRRTSKTPARMKKGSAAAKRHMAKLRRMKRR